MIVTAPAKAYDLISEYHKSSGLKKYRAPNSKSAYVRPSDDWAVMYPTTTPKAFASITRAGIAITPARIRGKSRCVTGERPRLSSASICSVTHLLLPRILAGVIAIPALVMLANAFGVVVGYITAKSSLGLTYADFEFGARYFFRPLDLWYSLIKSYAFACAVTIIPCYIGFNTQQGAEGVGRATTQAVVASSVTVLFLDTILTKLILGTAK